MGTNVIPHCESTTATLQNGGAPAVERLKSTSGAAHVLEQGVRNLRNSTSAQNVYGASMPNAKLAIIGKTTAVTIGGGVANDTILLGLHITAALTGTCVIAGFADSDGTATSITLPAATTAGFKDFRGAINAAGALTVTCSNAADDNLVSVLYWPTA